jgi:NADP-dependent 3-hydroxy acid dehydrogenase YdfG
MTGRTLAKVESVATDLGSAAEAAEVDALDERAIEMHLKSVIDRVGRIDISFNAVGIPNTKLQGVALSDLDVDRFSLPPRTPNPTF